MIENLILVCGIFTTAIVFWPDYWRLVIVNSKFEGRSFCAISTYPNTVMVFGLRMCIILKLWAMSYFVSHFSVKHYLSIGYYGAVIYKNPFTSGKWNTINRGMKSLVVVS